MSPKRCLLKGEGVITNCFYIFFWLVHGPGPARDSISGTLAVTPTSVGIPPTPRRPFRHSAQTTAAGFPIRNHHVWGLEGSRGPGVIWNPLVVPFAAGVDASRDLEAVSPSCVYWLIA